MEDVPVMERPLEREIHRLFSNRAISGEKQVDTEKEMGALMAATIVERRRIDALRISELTILANEALENLVTGFTGYKTVTTANSVCEQKEEKTV